LCSAPVLSLPDLQYPFEIEIDALDYAVGVVLTQHGHPVAYHSETLSDVVCKYPTYDKEMYSIVQAYRQWRHYILGKETVIHNDHKPLQFMQTRGKLQNDHHQKWSTYLQQFHLNIKYKTRSTNCIIDFLSKPPVVALTTVLDSYDHETSRWPQLYETNPNFTTTYQMLGANTVVDNFHLQDGLLCRLGHICVPSSEQENLDLGSSLQSGGKTLRRRKDSGNATETFLLAETSTGGQQVYQVLHCLCFSKPTIKKQGMYTPLPTPDRPWESISMDYMLGLPSTKQGNDYVFVVLIAFLRQRFWLPSRRTSQ
jgi:hypothetical protein